MSTDAPSPPRYVRKSADGAQAAATAEKVKKPTKAEKAARAQEAQLLEAAETDSVARAQAKLAPPPSAEAPQRRGKPARDAKEFLDEEGKPLTRRSTRDRSGNAFDIPAHLKKAGWSYEWKTIRVLAAPVDASEMTDNYENGWRPVPSKDMKELVPPGYETKHIERGGQILMMRPLHLTEEAQNEMIEIAEEQRYDKLQGALAGPQELGKVARRQVTEMELYGEAGRAHRRAS